MNANNETAPVEQMIENVMTQGRTLTSGGGKLFQGSSNFRNVAGLATEGYTPKMSCRAFCTPPHSRSFSGPYAPLHAAINT